MFCFFCIFVCLSGTGIYPLDHMVFVQVEQFRVYIYMGVSKNSGTPKWMVWRGYSLVTSA